MNRSRKLPAGERMNHFTPDRFGQIRRLVHRAAYTPGGMQDKPPPTCVYFLWHVFMQ
jgi:hypothetical protein